MGLWTPFPQERLAGTLMPEETIGWGAALRMWTINNAYATFEEDHMGTVKPGKLADLAVPSGDPLTVPDERFLDIEVVSQLNVDGRTLLNMPRCDACVLGARPARQRACSARRLRPATRSLLRRKSPRPAGHPG
jgi:hypothetical protein